LNGKAYSNKEEIVQTEVTNSITLGKGEKI
jgi:hypothetical protein